MRICEAFKSGGWEFLGIVFFLFLFWLFFGFRGSWGKKTRQEATARKDRKEGRKEGRRKEEGRAGRNEGRDRIFGHICAGNTGNNSTLNPEPKPYCPKALNHLTP